MKHWEFWEKDTLGRVCGHGDREIAGTTAKLFVLWAGAGFSWKFGPWGAQRGRPRENVPGGPLSERIRGVSGDAGRRGTGRTRVAPSASTERFEDAQR